MHGCRVPLEKLTCMIGTMSMVWLARNPMRIVLAQSKHEQELLFAAPEKLADQVAKSGDPAKGAVLFHSPTLGCFQCHCVDDEKQNVISPDLALWDKQPTTLDIIDSVLKPSAKVDPKFTSTRVLTVDVWRVSGLDSINAPKPEIQWQRIATGLFQPLGILAYKD